MDAYLATKRREVDCGVGVPEPSIAWIRRPQMKFRIGGWEVCGNGGSSLDQVVDIVRVPDRRGMESYLTRDTMGQRGGQYRAPCHSTDLAP
jgi:hypothetical protein